MTKNWQELVDPLLLHIFSYLSPVDLIHSSQACLTWYRVAFDESLWKQHVQNKWKIKGCLAPEKVSWFSEYKRLYFHAPTENYAVLQEHKDEVLDVSFSHNGQYFCTTSKDATVKIWKMGKDGNAFICHQDNLLIKLGWNLTQYSVFNRTDTLLLVCGVKIPMTVPSVDPSQDTYTPLGYGTVYSMKNFQLLTVMVMDPPHLFGDWFDDKTCVGGFQEGIGGIFKVRGYKISEKEVFSEDKSGSVMCTFESDSRRAMNLLVVKVPKALFDGKNGVPAHRKVVLNASHEKKVTENKNETVKNQVVNSEKYEKVLVVVTGGHHDKLAFYRISSTFIDDEQKLDAKTSKNTSNLNNSSHRFTRSASRQHLNQQVHTIKLPGRYISGLKLSLDERYLFINSRQCVIKDDSEYPSLLEDLEIHAVDLQTCKLITDFKVSGHKAFSEYPAWYICLDACQDYVVSGSEEALGYLWDRHYGCLLKTFQHQEGVVNGVAFNPVDPETMVTVGDDHVIKIWCSKNRLKELPKTHNSE